MNPPLPFAVLLAWAPWGHPTPLAFTAPAYGVLFLLGLAFGSFLNVVVYRLPRGQSIAWPPSSCPVCEHAIRPWDNLPLVSWFVLRGRCRDCGAPISIRYPLVELLGGGLVVAVAHTLGPRLELLPALGFALALVAVALIDFDFRIIPDEISIGGAAIGLLARGFTFPGILEGLVGVLVGAGSLYLVAWAYRRITGIEGLGGGDVKLAGMIGAFLGWPGVFLTIFAAALVGSLVGLGLIGLGRGTRRTALPFGAFLAPAAVLAALIGPVLWHWYGGLIGPL